MSWRRQGRPSAVPRRHADSSAVDRADVWGQAHRPGVLWRCGRLRCPGALLTDVWLKQSTGASSAFMAVVALIVWWRATTGTFRAPPMPPAGWAC